ncbi:MAG: hypothetical protein HY762_04240 [Planctomycetes bacterium]|nr:hypothetical protein [Planctomycetota bacterium]
MKYGLGALLLVGILVLTGCSKTAPMLHRDGGPAPITAETKPSVQDESVDLSLVPVEYRDQVKESLKLAGDNGSELLKVLQTLTIPEERAGAAFLIGTLPYPDLAAIKADVLLEHIRYAYLIKNKYPWMKNMPEETFLHYVLPYRCAEEPISAYRRYFYEQLDPIVSQCTNLSDVAHQVNLWLGAPKPAPSRTDGVGNGKQRFRFVQTEARDQGPLASLKSGYGRCEEMMIIYICAARSVGVPCRSSWTPYWAICDNNHAWVEVWISGSWKPLGGCEPGAPWFADPAKRAAAVYSATIGKPQSELIHKTIGNSSIINSTPNYSKTCRVKVSVVDADNKPVTDTTVVFAVFNWGSFRPFATKITDGQGQVEFVTGIGEYFLSTGRNDMRAWQVVKTEPGKTLEITFKLAKNAAPDGFIFLRYPTLDQARTSFTTPGLTPVYTSPLTPTYPAPPEIYFYEEFNPALHSDVMALMEGYAGKDAVVQKLKSAGGNWTEMAGAITEIRPELRPDLFHIITQLAHLEAIEVTKEFLLDTVIYADSARSRSKWQIPDDIHKAYVLNPQFEYLHISPWRKELSGRFLPIIIAGYNPDAKIHSDTITDTARAVNEWVAANIKVRGDLGGRFSYVASPLDTLKTQSLGKGGRQPLPEWLLAVPGLGRPETLR